MRAIAAAALVAAALMPAPASANPIVVTPNAAGAAMVANLLGVDSGITVVAGSEVYTGSPLASGLFTGGAGILPFDSGLLLTTGAAGRVPGPNLSDEESTANGTPGDAALSAIAGVPTFDAALLAFSFIPEGDTVSFQYVFGSEEYLEFVGGEFNDAFAFLLNGVNIALIPGTTTPVAINNVNEGSNANYFAVNSPGAGVLNIQYDGLVGSSALFPLYATGAVTPGAVNTIVLGIADAGDDIYDSGVLLAAGSFVNQPPPGTEEPPPPPPAPVVPEPASLLLMGTGALLVARMAKRRVDQVASSK